MSVPLHHACHLQGVEKHYNSVPEIDAIEDMRVTEPEAVEAARKLTQLESRLKEHTGSSEAPVCIPAPASYDVLSLFTPLNVPPAPPCSRTHPPHDIVSCVSTAVLHTWLIEQSLRRRCY